MPERNSPACPLHGDFLGQDTSQFFGIVAVIDQLIDTISRRELQLYKMPLATPPTSKA